MNKILKIIIFSVIMLCFLFTDSMMNTALYNKWKSYKMDVENLEPRITKTILHTLCMNGNILAFTYDIMRSKSSGNVSVLFKVLPDPKITNFTPIWNRYYLTPQEITNVDFDLNVYICKEIVFKLTKNPDVVCVICNTPTYQKENYCLNIDCSNMVKRMNYLQYISNENGKVLKTVNDLDGVGNGFSFHCKKCNNCRICQKKKTTGIKCKRHKICKHFKNDRNYYPSINRLAILNNSN